MRTLVAVLCVMTFGVARAFPAGTTVKEYQATLTLDASAAKILKLYVAGMGEGVFWANVFSASEKKKPLYCQPENLKVSGDDYVTILNSEIETQSTRITAAELQAMPIGQVLVMGLERTFPCLPKGK